MIRLLTESIKKINFVPKQNYRLEKNIKCLNFVKDLANCLLQRLTIFDLPFFTILLINLEVRKILASMKNMKAVLIVSSLEA